MLSKLQYISQGINAREQIKNIYGVLDAGCELIQLRFKNASSEELYKTAAEVRKICLKYNALLIINDNAEVAKNVDADGVHLGLLDMPVSEARFMLGYSKIIGGTANTFADVLMRIEEKCDYVGLGPYRYTQTKENLSPVLGLAGIRRILDDLKKLNKNIPVFCIGGITINDVPELLETGIFGLAISGEITREVNKKELLTKYKQLLYD